MTMEKFLFLNAECINCMIFILQFMCQKQREILMRIFDMKISVDILKSCVSHVSFTQHLSSTIPDRRKTFINPCNKILARSRCLILAAVSYTLLTILTGNYNEGKIFERLFPICSVSSTNFFP